MNLIVFVSLAITVSAVAYIVLASIWRLFPFSLDETDDERLALEIAESEDYLLARYPDVPETCGLICRGGSERRGCDCHGPKQCPYRQIVQPDPWSGVEHRHGDDGNSGHG